MKETATTNPSASLHSLKRREMIVGYLFILPNLIGFLLFIFIPIVASLVLSFFEWDLLSAPDFVGFGNYFKMLGKSLFKKTFFNTIYFTFVSVPITVITGIVCAALVDRVKHSWFYKLSLFLPYIIPMVGAALIWQSIYMPDFGILEYLLNKIGISSPGWLSDPHWAMPAVIIMSIWKNVGFTFIIILAGLQGIPRMYYEAAEIDGASGIRQFFSITLPLLSPTIFFTVVISLIVSFQMFDQAFILTSGGPANATKTLVYHIYTEGFEYLRMGYASAVSWILLVVIFLFTIVQFAYQRRWVSYEI